MGIANKKFDILAEISEKFSDSNKPILVGGSAVEFYTRGRTRSLDLDLIGNRSEILKILKDFGFKRDGRHFYKGDIDIEIVNDNLYGEKSTILKYKTKKIRIICVEDLIVDRLNDCRYWKDIYGCEQAKMLLNSYKGKLDKNYLRNRANQEGVSDLL